MKFRIGVDLGQSHDYTAFAVIEETDQKVFEVRHLERHRNKPYPALVDRFRSLVLQAPGKPRCAIDATGVGRPVIDMIRDRVNKESLPAQAGSEP